MEVTYHAIYQDFSEIKFISFEKALHANPPLIIKQTREYVQNFQYKNLHISFNFFNQQGTEIFELSQGNWVILNISVGPDNITGFQRTDVVSDVCDPRGIVKRKTWSGGLSGVIRMLQFLVTASKLQDWDMLELSERNERLHNENDSLKNRIKNLESEVENLKTLHNENQ